MYICMRFMYPVHASARKSPILVWPYYFRTRGRGHGEGMSTVGEMRGGEESS